MLSKPGQSDAARKTSVDAVAQTLQSVGQEMSRAVESLIRAGAAEISVVHLGKAAAGLEQLTRRLAATNATGALAAYERMQWLGPLKEIAQRTAQADRLLASSAAFYTGWFSAAPVATGGYTADGCWAVAQGSGGLSLKA